MHMRTGGPLLHAQTGNFGHNRGHRKSTSGRVYIFFFILAVIACVGGFTVYGTFHSLNKRSAEQEANAALHRRGARHVIPKFDAESNGHAHQKGESHHGHAMRHSKAMPTQAVPPLAAISPDQRLKRSLLTNAKSPTRSMYHTGGTRGVYHTVKDRQHAAHGGGGAQHGGSQLGTQQPAAPPAPGLQHERGHATSAHSPELEKHAPVLEREGVRTTHQGQHAPRADLHAGLEQGAVTSDAQGRAEASATHSQGTVHHAADGHGDVSLVADAHAAVAVNGEVPAALADPHSAEQHGAAEEQQSAEQVAVDPHVAEQHAAGVEATDGHSGVEHPSHEAVTQQAKEAEEHATQGTQEQHVAVVAAGQGTAEAVVHAPANAATSLFELSAVTIDGVEQSLEAYRGKVVLVVNVASACGFTDANYKGLTRTYSKYKSNGLVVLGFPCNQFGSQESGSEADIKALCTDKYNVDFPMFSKVDVTGAQAHPVFQFLRHHLPVSEGGGGGVTAGKDLTWNFNKILVDPLGRPLKLYGSEYDIGKIESDIYDLLKEHSSKKAEQPTTQDTGVTTPAVAPAQAATSLFDLSAVNIDGQEQSLAEFRNNVVLVVNVASACGYTDANYKGLMETYTKYKSNGFTILGFPCNQFGAQESGTNGDIRTFCTDKYHVSFPMFSKVDVNGDDAHPVFKFLRHHLAVPEGGGGGVSAGKELSWNFNKFLVDKHGRPVRLFGSEYDVGAIESAIYHLLKAS